MPRWAGIKLTGLALVLVAMACGPTPSNRAGSGLGESAPATPVGPKRITAAIMGDAHTLYNKLNPGNNVAGIDALQELVHTGVSHFDRFGMRGPRLAEDVPTVENGLWLVSPDGRMETTWRIEPAAQWHDGTPVTADDLLFTVKMMQDRELPIFRDRNLALVEAIEAADTRTVTAKWRQPFIQADTLFTYSFALPVPRHLLEGPFTDDKASFLELPYWSSAFVGAGAYRLQEYARGSHVLLEANDRYILGRPKIDAIEVKFIPDSNVIMANLMAGAVDVTIGRTLSVDQAVQLRDQWKDGRMDVGFKSWIVIYPQFINPTPAIVSDVQFRRALYHAIDRQQMADSLMAGLSTAAHSYLNPQVPEAREVDAYVVRYDYDPRRAGQMIEGLGYHRGSDSGYRDNAGQRLEVSMMATAQLDIHAKSMFAVAGDWQKIGVAVEPYPLTLTLSPGRERGGSSWRAAILWGSTPRSPMIAWASSQEWCRSRRAGRTWGQRSGRTWVDERSAVMAERTRLYVGTERGLFIWRATNGGWDQELASGLGTGPFWRIEGSRERPEQVFVAVSGHGLFRTDDGGKRWAKVLDRDVRSVTVDPTDERVVYAGTEPVRVYRSEDSGQSWEELTSLQDMPEEVKKEWWFPVPPNIAHVLNIFVHPDDPNRIYLCLEHGGVVHSLDRGLTWEDVSEGIDYVDMHMLSSLPHRLDRYYVSSAQGFFTSEDPAKGWVRAENGFTRDYFHDFLFLPPIRPGENPTMLAATADKSPGSWARPEHARAAVFRSFDCAASWHQVGEGLPDSLEPAIWGLAGHPDNPNTAFVGLGRLSMRTLTENGGGSVVMTRDRGDNWETLPLEMPAVRALWAAAV